MKKIKIEDFPNDKFEGWLWYSNEKMPKIIEGETVSNTAFTAFPFIVEGMLWNEEKRLSIAITYHNGAYVITQAKVPPLDKKQITTYLADQKKLGKSKIQIYQHWQEQPDQIFNELNVLTPSWFAFVGFE